MRKMIVVAAVLAATSAQAAEELKFGDVNYFLKQGQINLLADLNSAYEKETIGGETVEKRGLVTDAALGYAFSDRLNAFVGLSYAYDVESENKSVATDSDFNNDGLANPALGVNYRFLSQNEARYNVDFGAVLRYGIEDAERGYSEGNDTADSNFASGRDSLEINARMGRKWNEANEWQLAAGAVYNADGEFTQKSSVGDFDFDEESSLDYFARATYQYRPVNEFMVLVSAQASYIGETEVSRTGFKREGDAHLDLDFRFTAKYLITENFIGKFNYGMARNSEYDIETNSVSGEVQKRRENFFGLGVEFLF